MSDHDTDRTGLADLSARFKSRQGGSTPRPSADAESTPVPRASGGARRNVGVYLPREVKAALQERSKARGVTLTYLVEEAFNDHGANYAALSRPTTGVGMPGGPDHRVRGSQQVQLRLTGEQVAWLDKQVSIYAAPSRSALVTAVLRRHFRL